MSARCISHDACVCERRERRAGRSSIDRTCSRRGGGRAVGIGKEAVTQSSGPHQGVIELLSSSRMNGGGLPKESE